MQNITITAIAKTGSVKPSPFTDGGDIVIRKGDPIAAYRKPDCEVGDNYWAMDGSASLFVQGKVVEVRQGGHYGNKIVVVPSDDDGDVVALAAQYL